MTKMNLYSIGCLLIYLLLGALACKPQQVQTKMEPHKKSTNSSADNRYIISAIIVKKQGNNKAGKALKQQDFYIRMSVQDYFIKFCESNINKATLEKALESQADAFQNSIKLEISYEDGLWDACDNHEIQSRVGPYVVIHQIME